MSLLTNTLKCSLPSETELTVSESAQIIKSITPKHPALSRLHSQLKSESGTSAITSYDRMHHRHSRS